MARVFKSGHIHNWINYSWLAVSFPTACLTGPAVRVFLVSRNSCVPGCLLNSVLGADACQLWQCCNNYQPSLFSHPLIPVQCAALLVGACVSLTHSKSLKSWNWEDCMALQSTLYFDFPRTYSIIPLENSHSLSFIQSQALYLTHIAAFFTQWEKHCSGFFMSRERAWETPHSCPLHFQPTSFCLPVTSLFHGHTQSPSITLCKNHKANNSFLFWQLP